MLSFEVFSSNLEYYACRELPTISFPGAAEILCARDMRQENVAWFWYQRHVGTSSRAGRLFYLASKEDSDVHRKKNTIWKLPRGGHGGDRSKTIFTGLSDCTWGKPCLRKVGNLGRIQVWSFLDAHRQNIRQNLPRGESSGGPPKTMTINWATLGRPRMDILPRELSQGFT